MLLLTKQYLTVDDIENIKNSIEVGQKIVTYKVPWSRGQGRRTSEGEEYRKRVGYITAKYTHFFLAYFECGIRECFKYCDLVTGDVKFYNDDTNDKE